MEKYGKEFLEAIQNYVEENDIEIENFDLDYGVYSVHKNSSTDSRTNEIIDYFVANISKSIC